MILRDIRRYEMLVRVRDFGDAHASLFPADALGARAFADVATAVDALREHASLQTSGRGSIREGQSSKTAVRAVLRDQLDAIVRTAQAIALDTPNVETRFRRPRGGGDEALLNTARTFARDAVQFVPHFTQHALSADFLTTLGATITSFETAIRARHKGREVDVVAQAAIDAAMERGMAAVQRLDAVVRNTIGSNPLILAAWLLARQIAYRVARARNEGQQADAPTPQPGPALAAATPAADATP